MRVTVKDVDQHEFVQQVASFLKKTGKVKVPEWSDVVKLGVFKELAPLDPDWYYTRTASVARHLYLRSPAGVGAFKKIYGGRKRRGSAPAHFCRASGSVARKCLQTLEAIKWAEKHPTGGRRLSVQGRKDLDRIATHMKQAQKQPAELC
ncbi:unnamed protein product [Soboliphyme baturini]|uniref:40S ribosomal protein S19 n=1 Tax=Soboliphyme baturini TaxID=241478 RepID=A0A183I960_9BILA|nr:unnamed protein product [Soboliphyme baturini]